MTCAFRVEGDTITISLESELDALTAPALEPDLCRLATSGPTTVVLDAARLQLLDGRGVKTIVSLRKELRRTGVSLFLQGMHGQPLALAQLVRLDRLVPSYPERARLSKPGSRRPPGAGRSAGMWRQGKERRPKIA